MFDSIDPRWTDSRDRDVHDELGREIYRDSRERNDDPRDALLNDLDLPRGHTVSIDGHDGGVTLTDCGRDLLDANRRDHEDDRQQQFYAGVEARAQHEVRAARAGSAERVDPAIR